MHTHFENISVMKLCRSATNPRKPETYDYEEWKDGQTPNAPADILELAASIKANGIIEPLVVRKKPRKDEYEIIAGHRRKRAAEVAGILEVPCSVVSFTGSAITLQLIENLQRESLTPAETANGVGQMIAEKIKQKDIATQLGKSEAWVSKFATIAKALKKVDDPTISVLGTFTDSEKLYKRSREILGLDAEAPAKQIQRPADLAKSLEHDDGQILLEEKIAEQYEAAIAEFYEIPAEAVKFVQHRNGGVSITLTFLTIDGFKDSFLEVDIK